MSPGFIYVVLKNRGMQQTTVTIESEAHLTRIIGAVMGGNALTKDRPAFCGKCTYGVPAEVLAFLHPETNCHSLIIRKN